MPYFPFPFHRFISCSFSSPITGFCSIRQITPHHCKFPLSQYVESSMVFKRISELHPGEANNEIEIRVIKRWKPHSKIPELCYLFVDIRGDAIEAIVDANQEAYFSTVINVQSCYVVESFVTVPSRTYKAVVPHTTSIRVGRNAKFVPIHNDKIPTFYYNFVPFHVLQGRKTHTILIDFVGRVERVRTIITKNRLNLKKILIQDEGGHVVEITLWQNGLFEVDTEKSIGKVLAVTSSMVTEHEGHLQLETTPATTISINPPIPDLNDYIERYKGLKVPSLSVRLEKRITIADLKLEQASNKEGRYEIDASVTHVFNDRTWYYAICSECSKHLYPSNGGGYVCVDDGFINQPKYKYCVNSTIADATGSANVVFFDEAMTSIIHTSCVEMVVNKGYTNPKVLPTPILTIRGISKVLHVNLKKDGLIAINNVFDMGNQNTSALEPPEKKEAEPCGFKQRKKRNTSSQGYYSKAAGKRLPREST